MANGVRSTNLDPADMVDELLANRTADNVKASVRVPVVSFSAQLASSGPIPNKIAAEIAVASAALQAEIDIAAAGVVRLQTWTELSAVTGTRAGQPASVQTADGTHTDPVVGGTVDNQGEYSWSVDPAGWKWIGELQLSPNGVIAEVTTARGDQPTLASRFEHIDEQIYLASAGVIIPGSNAQIVEVLVDVHSRAIRYRDTDGKHWRHDAQGALRSDDVIDERAEAGIVVPGFDGGTVISVEVNAENRGVELLCDDGSRWRVGTTGTYEKIQTSGDLPIWKYPDGFVVPGMPVGVSDGLVYADEKVSDIVGVDGRPYAMSSRARWEPADADPNNVDVVVFGSGLGGLMAMVRAAMRGKRVAMVEPYERFGGMHAAGLTWIDVPALSVNPESVIMGGLTNSLYFDMIMKRVGVEHKYSPDAWVCEEVANELIERFAVRAIRNSQIDGNQDVKMGLDRWGRPVVKSIWTREGILRGTGFVDASYEGDLMAVLGPDHYIIGRESAAEYGETNGGATTPGNFPNLGAAFPHYSGAGSPAAIGYPFVPNPGQSVGDADHRSQSYNFRVPMTRDPANRLDFPKRPGYDNSRLTTWLQILRLQNKTAFCRSFAAGDFGFQGDLVNNKVAFNALDLVNRNFDYPGANWTDRRLTIQEHADWMQDMLWCIKHDPITRDYGLATLQDDALDAANGGVNQIGLCADEFTGSPYGRGWPWALYVREARRLKAVQVMTEDDVNGSGADLLKAHSIGKWSYYMDIHAMQAFQVDATTIAFEGGIGDHTPTPVYQMPFESIVPQESACVNLVVPVCAGYSHLAHAPSRLEIPWGFSGEAGGEALAWYCDNQDQTVQSIPYAELSARLLQNRSKL